MQTNYRIVYLGIHLIKKSVLQHTFCPRFKGSIIFDNFTEFIMKQFLLMMSVVIFGFANQSQAHEGVIHVVKSVKINASANTVWEKVDNFGDLGAWHPAVAKTDIVEGDNNKVGAKRVLTLQDGGKINETLTAYNDKKKTMSYVITDGVLPVRDYSAVITVKSAGKNKAIATWSANFKRKDPSATPAAGQDDKAAKDAISGVFDGGLTNLKKIVEAK